MNAFVRLLFAGALCATQFAFANAIATNVTGTVQVATGAAAPRAVRVGDTIRQGDTVITGAQSSAVLRFEDGQVAGLTSNSRMTVTTYAFNPTSGGGNVLLSLISGGMRAITGLIGRNQPAQVSYRAATATIGIRGTDVSMATIGGDVVVTVTEGLISFTFAGQTITVPAGEGVNARTDGKFQQGAASTIINQISPELQNAINGLTGLQAAISQAAAGQGGQLGIVFTTPSTTAPPTIGGGGTASTR
jgi:hypothetical protein